METSETMLFGGAHITAVDHVKDLEEDEGVEHKSEASHLVCVLDSRVAVCVAEAEDSLTGAHDDHHDADHTKHAAEDLAVHERGHEVALASSVGLDSVSWRSRGKSQGTKDIHDQVNVDELDRVQDRFLLDDVADQNDEKDGDVAGNLELEEALDVHENVTAPHDSLHG